MNWNTIWNSIVAFFTGNIWKIIGFFATLFIGVVVVKLLLNITRTMLRKAKMERIAQQFICTSLKLILYSFDNNSNDFSRKKSGLLIHMISPLI